jgi:tetrathionate reductase subunit B
MYEGKDELVVMHEDLQRALKKPTPVWSMLIDTRRCILCHACTVGCMVEYKSPPGIRYRPMYEIEEGTYPRVRRLFVARPCQQCDNPPCVSACPKPGVGKATWKGADGIVMINYEQCIACGRCVAACPYGARSLDNGSFYTENTPNIPDMERGPVWEYDKQWLREGKKLPAGKSRKCHFCHHRLKNGLLPVCVTTCIGRATYFGDTEDPESLIGKVIKTVKTITLKEIKGSGKIADRMKAGGFNLHDAVPIFGDSVTKPRVYYVV